MTDTTRSTPPRSKLPTRCLLLGLIPFAINLYYLLLIFVAMNTNQTNVTSPFLWNVLVAIGGPSMYAVLYLLPTCFLASMIVITIGYLHSHEWKDDASNPRGRRAALIGVKLGYASLFLAVFVFFLVYIPAHRELRHDRDHEIRENSCSRKLRKFGLVFKMFANESKGQVYPQLSPNPGTLMFSNQNEAHPNPIYPEILSDLKIFACPEDEDVNWDTTDDPTIMIDDQSYFYLGYAITNQDELQAFAQAYKQQIADDGTFAENLPVPEGTGTAGTNTLHRLREDLHARLNSDNTNNIEAASFDAKLPLLIERNGHHEPPGGNVLYFDGHVEYIKHGEWPMTDETHAILNDLDKIDISHE
jgi:prepilin-type processing-associated H-X9-DG protein